MSWILLAKADFADASSWTGTLLEGLAQDAPHNRCMFFKPLALTGEPKAWERLGEHWDNESPPYQAVILGLFSTRDAKSETVLLDTAEWEFRKGMSQKDGT